MNDSAFETLPTPPGQLAAIAEVGVFTADAPASETPGVADAAVTGGGPDQSPQAPRRGGLMAPLRLGSFRLLIGGQTISRLGDAFYAISIPWLVFRISHDPFALSLVLGSYAVATGLFTLIGGVLADRLGPRPLMIGSDIVRFALIAGLATLALVTTPLLWELIVISALLGVATGIFFPSSAAMIPFIVGTDDLQAANGIEQLSAQTSNFAGPAIAGLALAATELAFGFILDAASFAISVFTLIFVRVGPRPKRQDSEGPARKGGLGGGLQDLREAFGYLKRTPFLATVVSLSVVANFGVVGIFEVALPLLLKQMVGIDDGPRALGVVVSGFGLGSILGAIGAGVAGKLPHKPLIAILLILPIVGIVGALPFLGDIYTLAGAFAVLGLLLGASNVLFITVIQRFIPMEMMGRMMSIVMLGSFAGGPISIFVYGALATISPQISYLFLGGAAVLLVASIGALTNRTIWQTS